MLPSLSTKRVIVSLLIILGLGGLTAGDSAPKSAHQIVPLAELPDEFKDYPSWAKLNEAHHVPMRLWLLCISPTPAQLAEARKENGPHFDKSVQVYGNAVAVAALAKPGQVVLPVGSILVKEKGKQIGHTTTVDGLGVMIKRDGRKFKVSGGWEFLYFPLSGKKSKTHQACASCHQGVADRDYRFGDYPEKNGFRVVQSSPAP